jgi:hypothetical protein
LRHPTTAKSWSGAEKPAAARVFGTRASGNPPLLIV